MVDQLQDVTNIVTGMTMEVVGLQLLWVDWDIHIQIIMQEDIYYWMWNQLLR